MTIEIPPCADCPGAEPARALILSVLEREGLKPAPRLGPEAYLDHAYLSDQGKRFYRFAGALSVQYELTERAQTFLEYPGLSPRSKNAGNASYVNSGLIRRVNNDPQLDIGVGVGLNGQRNDYFFEVGVGRRF